MTNKIYQFNIPGHSTRREWAVYVIVASNDIDKRKFLYVGKVGDNNSGCNPMISRIGNHFSYNKIHSQIRNKIGEITTDFDYQVHYTTFGQYDINTHQTGRLKINEVERRLNMFIQDNLNENIEFLNPLKKRKNKDGLLTNDEVLIIQNLAIKATKY